MIRRSPWLRLVVGALCLVTMGCEPHRSWLRHNDDEDLTRPATDAKAIDSDTSKILGVDSDGKSSKPFFGGDRTSGGLSSEARSIEKDLGVN